MATEIYKYEDIPLMTDEYIISCFDQTNKSDDIERDPRTFSIVLTNKRIIEANTVDSYRNYILSHSTQNFEKFETKVPLIVVPSTYAHMNESELEKLGVNVIIYANHLLRSAYPAMMNAAKSILQNSRSKEASDKYCMSIKDVISLIPEVN